MKNPYQKTIRACFAGYIVQAICNNFAPLLFLTFEETYQIPMRRITLLITINFGIQLLVDLLSAKFIDRIGYRVSIVMAHLFSTLGLVALAVLPSVLPGAYAGILIAVALYAVGGGLIEVLIGPIVESCPADNKETAMSLLHSFYCWGQMGVVLLSSLFFSLCGTGNWKILAICWAILPLINGLIFTRVPLATLMEEGEQGLTIRELCRSRIFWLLFLMMLCAGASEQGVSQWASTFAEQGLGVSKTVGDLTGPMSFALFMGLARAFYGKFGEWIRLDLFMAGSSVLCILAYLCISLVPLPVLSLAGCALCGLSVGIMWPGSLSKASRALPGGGTSMFALLALAGDVGCSAGPTLAGFVSGLASDNLKMGILAGVAFPVLLLAGILLLQKKQND